jgi:hypothetical protein
MIEIRIPTDDELVKSQEFAIFVIPAKQSVSQSVNRQTSLDCHSGLDPESVRLQAGAVMQVQVLHREMPAPGSRR